MGPTPGDGATNDDGTVFSFAIGLGGTTASTNSLSLSPASVAVGSPGPVCNDCNGRSYLREWELPTGGGRVLQRIERSGIFET